MCAKAAAEGEATLQFALEAVSGPPDASLHFIRDVSLDHVLLVFAPKLGAAVTMGLPASSEELLAVLLLADPVKLAVLRAVRQATADLVDEQGNSLCRYEYVQTIR